MDEKRVPFRWAELEPYCILKWLLRNCYMIALSTLLFFLAAGIALTLYFQPKYTARVTFVVASKSSYSASSMDASAANSVAASFTELLKSGLMREKVVAAAGLSSFSGDISASNTENTNLITVSVTAPTARQSFLVLNAIMNHYAELTKPMFGDAVINILSAPNISQVSNLPVSAPQAKKMAALLGAGLMVLYLFCQCVQADTVQNETAARRKLDASLLAVIPHERSGNRNRRRALRITEPTVSFAFTESVHRLRARLEQQRQDTGRNVFLFTSVTEHEGKSLLVENTALSLAPRHNAVLIVDGDLRKASRFQPKKKDAGPWKVEKEYTSGPYRLCLARNASNGLRPLLAEQDEEPLGIPHQRRVHRLPGPAAAGVQLHPHRHAAARPLLRRRAAGGPQRHLGAGGTPGHHARPRRP